MGDQRPAGHYRQAGKGPPAFGGPFAFCVDKLARYSPCLNFMLPMREAWEIVSMNKLFAALALSTLLIGPALAGDGDDQGQDQGTSSRRTSAHRGRRPARSTSHRSWSVLARQTTAI